VDAAVEDRVDSVAVATLCEELGDRLTHARSDPGNGLELFSRSHAQAPEITEVRGKVACDGHSDLRNAERVQEAIERRLHAGADPPDERVRRLVREALELHELLGRHVEQLGELAHEAGLHEQPCGLVA
jgi:hypothetical protein